MSHQENIDFVKGLKEENAEMLAQGGWGHCVSVKKNQILSPAYSF
jgi:hypothetical protein